MNTTSYIKKRIFTLSCAALLLSAISACTNNEKPTEEKTEETAHGHEGHGNEIELSDQQISAVGIVIGEISQKNLTAVVKASGQLAVPPQNAAQINVLSGGIIRKINVIEGQRVTRGQVLVTIENQEMIKLQQDYLAAKGGFTYVEAEHNRQQQLKAANAGTGKAQELAEANYNAERSKIKALEHQLQQLGISPGKVAAGKITSLIPVTAPIQGTIGKINAETGSYAQPGVSIMDIVDNSKIHADLIVFEKDLASIKMGQKVQFRLTNQKNQEIEGEIYGINKSFENDSKGVVVHAVIKNPGANLIPGMYVTGLIGIGTTTAAAVPIDAVIRSEGKQYIFIVEDEAEDQHDHANEKDHDHAKEKAHEESKTPAGEHARDNKMTHFKKVEVSTGIAELGYIQINPLEKLPLDVRVVTKGAFYLQSKSSGPAAHDH
ncbi:efflux RND transporter periplasmic adaptor subunit [Pedobacter sp. MC2016-24]|uniref:efflux RND transporter periplasmic adaptor subunit n=1 Tax=Pedobacter sp. MC2016-24 TaxID=2780090 RepID=UPI001882C087|nr:efflux RND transporter periplasmic adaptor subunit [Pedobacter sp. MC2016-24]MBE9600224.1 efflux RND transporter periplasmic adaptor subunit [Pedobacter sp. MC2016-24]